MNLKIIVHLCQRGALAGEKPVTDNQLNQNLNDPKNKEAFEEDAETKAAVTDLDDSRAPTQMDFWANGEKKSNAEGSEISPEEEIKTLEGLGVVVVTFRSALLHVWDLVDSVCLSGDVSTVNQV